MQTRYVKDTWGKTEMPFQLFSFNLYDDELSWTAMSSIFQVISDTVLSYNHSMYNVQCISAPMIVWWRLTTHCMRMVSDKDMLFSKLDWCMPYILRMKIHNDVYHIYSWYHENISKSCHFHTSINRLLYLQFVSLPISLDFCGFLGS